MSEICTPNLRSVWRIVLNTGAVPSGSEIATSSIDKIGEDLDVSGSVFAGGDPGGSKFWLMANSIQYARIHGTE
jgi:hypothetical protein